MSHLTDQCSVLLTRALLVTCVTMFLLVTAHAAAVTQLDFPGSTRTEVNGVSGSNVVGVWNDSAGTERGFIYDGANYWTIDHPDSVAYQGLKTVAAGIDGNTAVGYYFGPSGIFGYRYDVPSGKFGATAANRPYASIDGSTIIGAITDVPGPIIGFIDNGTSFISVSHPDGIGGTFLYGYSAGRAVGEYVDAALVNHAFMLEGNELDGEVFTPIAYPGGDLTSVGGISGNKIVGSYRDGNLHRQGFIYEDGVYRSYSYPGAIHTRIRDIDGNLIVGYFTDSLGQSHGFIAQIPEPSTFCLSALAGLGLVLICQRRSAALRR